MDQFSRTDVVGLMDLASRCVAASTFPQFERTISSLNSLVAFEKAVLCAIMPGDTAPSVDHFVNHSYGPAWESVYTAERFHRVDPILMRCQWTHGAFRWSDLKPTACSRFQASFLEAAREHGLRDGVSFSCGGVPTGSPRTVVSLTGLRASEADRAMAILGIAGPHLHEAYRRLLSSHEAGCASPLSPREKDVLRWTQQGKSYWEIGRIMGISERTVKYHVERIKSKLDVVNAAHAVAKAMRLGIIA